MTRLAILAFLCSTLVPAATAQHTGIAIDTPSATLHVSGLVRADSLTMPSGAQAGHLLQADSAGAAHWAALVKESLPQLHRSGQVNTSLEISKVDARGQYAYMIEVTSGSLHVYDISGPEPIAVSSIYVGPVPYDLEMQGDYAIVMESTEDSIVIVDVSDPTQPQRRGGAHAEGAFWCDVSGNTILALGQFPSQLVSMDFSNPDSLLLLDTLTLFNYPGPLDVQGSYAYVSNLFEDHVYVIDIANSADMQLVHTINVGHPRRVLVADNTLYVAASSMLYIYDITEPVAPVLIDSSPAGIFACGSVTDLDLLGNILLWATQDGCILWYDVLSNDTIADLGFMPGVSGQQVDRDGMVVITATTTSLRRYDIVDDLLGVGMGGNAVSSESILNGTVEIRSDSLFDHLDFWYTQIPRRSSLTVTDPPGFLIAIDSVELFSFSAETGNLGIATPPGDARLASSFRIETLDGGLKFPDGTLQTTKVRDDLWYREGNAGTDQYDHLIGTSDSQPFQIGTNGIPRFYFTPNQKVGLGTANPVSLFTVSGPDDPIDGPIITLMGEIPDQVTSGEIRMRMEINNQAAGYIHYDGSANRLHVGVNPGYNLSGDDDVNAVSVHRNTGYVGIGTPNPEHPLHVESDQVSGQSITLVVGSAVSDRPVLLFSEVDSNLTFSAGMSIEYDHANMRTHFNSIGGSPAMTIESIGNVGIGLTNPSALLEVNSATVIKQTAGNWTASSDIRLKQDISSFTDGLETVLQIDPVWYRYNDLSGYNTTEKHVGVVAQELERVAPYMVGSFLKDDIEYLEVDNSAMIYLLINSIKELEDQQDRMQAALNAIRLSIQPEH